MKSLALLTLGLACWSVLVAWLAWRLGVWRGYRRSGLDATSAFDRGYLHALRTERAARRCDPGFDPDPSEEWKRGGRQ